MPTAVAEPVTNPPKVDLELVISRIFDAPRELVFRAWTGRSGSTLVGTAGFHRGRLRDGPATGRRLPGVYALTGGDRALAARRMPRCASRSVSSSPLLGRIRRVGLVMKQ